MKKSQRIYYNSDLCETDKDIEVRLEQETDSLEFLSMRIDTKDVYRDFNADYGVLVGRVIANGGVGIQNARISIFIPLAEEDYDNGEIKSIYPYKSPRDKNKEGKRYNLLPRVSRISPQTKQLEPKQPFGSFPIKEEVVTNVEFLNVYKKYYKYTALTNQAGDYMIFGVPTGTQTVHLSVDITDIGEFSMSPASMVTNLGYPASQFIDRNTRIKPSTDLGDLPNIETQEISVDVIPFWGDVENFEIGITRQDFRIRATLVNTFNIFGSAFTDSELTMRTTEDGNDPNLREIRDFFMVYPRGSWHGVALSTKRIGTIKETIYYYPSEMTDIQIDAADPQTAMRVLNKSEYSVYTRNGDFVFIVDCNRDKVITDELGNKIPVAYDNPDGVFTTFRGFVTLEYELNELPIIAQSGIEEKLDGTVLEKNKSLPLRLKYKFPQHAALGRSFDYADDNDARTWRKQHMKFEAQKFYSFSRFHACISNNLDNDENQFGLQKGIDSTKGGFFAGDNINSAGDNGGYNIGPIHVENFKGYLNSQYKMVANFIDPNNDVDRFGANWLNLCVYFPQTGYVLNEVGGIREVRTSDYLATQWEYENSRNQYFIFDNQMPIAAGTTNTKWYGRSDLHWTDIIELPLSDILNFRIKDKGFKLILGEFTGAYRNGNFLPPATSWKGTWSAECPYNGGRTNGTSSNSTKDSNYYFYKGFETSDCIEFLVDLGLVT